MGEFGTGFPVFLAINSQMPTWLQWCVGSLSLVFACVWIRVLAELTATQTEPSFSLWKLFKGKFRLRTAPPPTVAGQASRSQPDGPRPLRR